MQQTINILRSELATLDGRRTLVVDAIAALERLVGQEPTHVAVVDEMHRHAPGVPATPILRDELHEQTAPRDPVGAERVEALLSAERRATATLRQDERRVVDFLAASGPVSMRAVAEVLGFGRDQTKYLLTKLRKAGTVAADGETNNRVFRLAQPPRVTRREVVEDLEVVWDGASKCAPAEALQARREARS